jgi:uncharacterized membrane protein (DUF4010 family)
MPRSAQILVLALAVFSFVSIVVGSWMVHPAVGLIVAGVIAGFVSYGVAYVELMNARRRKED